MIYFYIYTCVCYIGIIPMMFWFKHKYGPPAKTDSAYTFALAPIIFPVTLIVEGFNILDSLLRKMLGL